MSTMSRSLATASGLIMARVPSRVTSSSSSGCGPFPFDMFRKWSCTLYKRASGFCITETQRDFSCTAVCAVFGESFIKKVLNGTKGSRLLEEVTVARIARFLLSTSLLYQKKMATYASGMFFRDCGGITSNPFTRVPIFRAPIYNSNFI